jgi:hypothetical protein
MDRPNGQDSRGSSPCRCRYWRPTARLSALRDRAAIEGSFWKPLDLAPGLGERVRNRKRGERLRGTVDPATVYRRPYGRTSVGAAPSALPQLVAVSPVDSLTNPSFGSIVETVPSSGSIRPRKLAETWELWAPE